MQTYEISPGETMGSLLGSLSVAAGRDKDIVLVVPPGANPFTGSESIAELIGAMRGYDASLRVKAADAELVSLFQSAGVEAGPMTVETLDAGPKGGLFSKLKGMLAQPASPQSPAGPASNSVLQTQVPEWAGPQHAPEVKAEPADEAALTGLDATMPEWLRDAPDLSSATGERGVGHMPVSNLDVTMPAMAAENPPPAATSDRPNEQEPEQEQTAESIAQAVSAAGLDARTRSMLMFGMALVRLASAEATGAAAAARQAGCTTEDLRLVVEMAHALGGGPSRYLGQKILGG